MKRIFCALACFISLSAIAQNDFEGVMTFRNELLSKSGGINSISWKRILLLGDSVRIAIKKGNYKQTSILNDIYILPSKQKMFIKMKGIDTLYYLPYSFDTSIVTAVTKLNDKKRIAGYECGEIIIQTHSESFKYFYAPSLHMNPSYNENYTINHENILAKETSSLYLEEDEENALYNLKQICYRVEPSIVDDKIFTLPDLPQKEFSTAAYIVPPQFSKKDGWIKFLQSKIDPTIAAKYLKPSRKQDVTTQEVMVSFIISETGNVMDVKVENFKEVNQMLAQEAVRVISMSPKWQPATALGAPIAYKMTQPVTFQVTK